MFNEFINVEEMLEIELVVTDDVNDDGPGFRIMSPADSNNTDSHAVNITVKEHI